MNRINNLQKKICFCIHSKEKAVISLISTFLPLLCSLWIDGRENLIDIYLKHNWICGCDEKQAFLFSLCSFHKRINMDEERYCFPFNYLSDFKFKTVVIMWQMASPGYE